MSAPHRRSRASPPLAHEALSVGVPVRQFLSRHWQKRALLVREAIVDAAGLYSADDLIALARRDDVESRLVVREGTRWSLVHGPFKRKDLKALPARNWTLLVQGVNLVSARGDALLRRFSFLPYARLDDLMVSYAAPGGGVGAHFDSYDVFLLQGFGRRRWRFGRQKDLTLVPDRPLRILKHFEPARSEVLSAGDMLYLPPQYAHEGIALDACTTYSIGFRAASAAELADAFLDHLRDEIALTGRYSDADLAPTTTPAEIGGAMLRRCERMLRHIAWDHATVRRFLGMFLSEPKPHVFFAPPERPLARSTFRARAAKHGVRLDLRTQLLYDTMHFFVNGSALARPKRGDSLLDDLADARALRPSAIKAMCPEVESILYTWYRDGYLHVES